MSYSLNIPHFSICLLSLSYSLSLTHTHASYHAEQQDSCPPSVNVIHEEMKIWAMNDEFFSACGPVNTSRKTTQSIYAKKREVNIQITYKKNIRGTKLIGNHHKWKIKLFYPTPS